MWHVCELILQPCATHACTIDPYNYSSVSMIGASTPRKSICGPGLANEDKLESVYLRGS